MGVNENRKVKVKMGGEGDDDKSQIKKPKELVFTDAERQEEEAKLEELRRKREE